MSSATMAAIAGCAIASAATAQLIDAEPTKANNDFISGTGIPSDSFMGDVDDVSVYIKARARSNGDPIAVHGNTYIVLDGPAPSSTASWWSFDFQFVPTAADTTTGPNYDLALQLDIDGTSATNFVSVAMPMFDADADSTNSWDDNDGYFVNPGPGLWSDDTIDYVNSQSWRPDFGFLAGSILPAGDYDLRFAAEPSDGPKQGSTVSRSALVRVIPAGSAALTLDAQNDCLDGSETQVVVEVNLANAQDIIVGGQFFLQYDTSKLTFVSADAGDAPFSSEVFELVDAGLGEITYAVGIPSGVGTDDATTMARLTFNVTGDFCAEDDLVAFRTGILPTRITDSSGTSIVPTLVNTHLVTRDSVAPTITAQADILYPSDAGSCSALINFDPSFDYAVANDNCSVPTVTYQRSDGLSLADPFPQGPTTITWRAEDACGNFATDSQVVTVSGSSLLDVAVELQGVVDAGPFTRCITFELTPTGGGVPVVVSADLSFTSGFALDTIAVPCSANGYECITARDTLHTLRRTDAEFGVVGTSYNADFTNADGGDELTGGNLNDDSFIDILDFGLFIGQFGTSVAASTPCGFVGPHADVTGDGMVNGGDFTFIQINFLDFSELDCQGQQLNEGGNSFAESGSPVRRSGPVTSISVDDLIAMGMGDLAGADLNADGMLDTGDVAAFLSGARPDHMADIDASGLVDFFDVQKLLGVIGQQAGEAYDMNGDGIVTAADLHFVIARMGMQF